MIQLISSKFTSQVHWVYQFISDILYNSYSHVLLPSPYQHFRLPNSRQWKNTTATVHAKIPNESNTKRLPSLSL